VKRAEAVCVLLILLLASSCGRDVVGPKEASSSEDPIIVVIDFGTRDSRPEESFCKLHNEQLREDSIPVVYGLRCFPPGFHDARKNQFPFANSSVSGGCIVGPTFTALTGYCPTCRQAKSTWWKEHHNVQVVWSATVLRQVLLPVGDN
jgi:hypothetical protein